MKKMLANPREIGYIMGRMTLITPYGLDAVRRVAVEKLELEAL
jgi:hypothetical protein